MVQTDNTAGQARQRQEQDLPLPPGMLQRDFGSAAQPSAPAGAPIQLTAAQTQAVEPVSTPARTADFITSGATSPIAVEAKPEEAPAAPTGQRAVYDAIGQRMSQLPRITEADVEAARQRHKRNAMIGSLGDGLRALSNLYFTTQGAPSSYVPSGIPEREQQRYQRIVNARQAADEERLRLTMLADNLRRQDEAAASKAGMAELDRQYKWARVQQISQRIETDRMNLQLASERLQHLIAKGAAQTDIDAATIALRQAQTNLANSRAALVDVQIQYYPRLTDARIGAANRSNRGRTSTRSISYSKGLPVSETTTVTVDNGDTDIVMP
jgi:hypothetical protein